MRIRSIALWTAVAACSSNEPDGDANGSTQKAEACHEERDCVADDQGCAAFPYEQLPPRCYDICYRHYCCSYDDYTKRWGLTVYDCAFPMTDAGVDAP
jgi:hypothetical protein